MDIASPSSSSQPAMSSDSGGYFGDFGGRYVPEALIPALEELEQAFTEAQVDPLFQAEFENLLKNFAGRPTPLTSATGLTRMLGGATLYFKNEGLNITGAHKITHCLGQALLAKRLGKTRLIAETGAGQHGLATATVAAKLGFERCVVPHSCAVGEFGTIQVFPVHTLAETLDLAF